MAAGDYFIIGKIGQAKISQETIISARKLTEITLNANADALQTTAPAKTYVTIFSGEKNLDGSKTDKATVEIKAGKRTEISLNPQ